MFAGSHIEVSIDESRVISKVFAELKTQAALLVQHPTYSKCFQGAKQLISINTKEEERSQLGFISQRMYLSSELIRNFFPH